MTDHVEFERMVLDILSYLDYPGIDPQSPTLPDGGKDGVFYLYSEAKAIWFAFSLQKTWKAKFKSDLDKALCNYPQLSKFVFCSNQQIPALARDSLIAECQNSQAIAIEFYDGERLRVALDTICKDLRRLYLGIHDNSEIRRSLRYVLLDPESEVVQQGNLNTELSFLPNLAPRGVFELLKNVQLSNVSETPEELRILNELIEAYFQFRRANLKLNNYALNAVGTMLKGNNFLPFWSVVTSYCIERIQGVDAELALKRSQVKGVNHGGSECINAFEQLKKDPSFGSLLLSVREKANLCISALLTAQSTVSLVDAPRLTIESTRFRA